MFWNFYLFIVEMSEAKRDMMLTYYNCVCMYIINYVVVNFGKIGNASRVPKEV